MKKVVKSVSIFCVCAILLAVNFLTPVAFAASNVYEITFDNLFIFEQWANHANFKALAGDGSATSTVTADIAKGSFVLTNNTTSTEVFTNFSMTSASDFYSIPVEGNTEYVFSYNASGASNNFETFVFYFDTQGKYLDLQNEFAYNSGVKEWSFTTPENAGYIHIRFDNNVPNTSLTVSDIRICSRAVYDYAKSFTHRQAFTYSEGITYGQLPEPERENLVFAGWFTEPNGAGEKITADTIIKPASTCLYSKWDPVAESMKVVSLPVKQSYCVGEKLNTRGLVIGVTYPDGTKENIDEGFTCSPMVLTQTGTQTITVTYGKTSVEFTVDVKASDSRTVNVNGSQKTVNCANYGYSLNYSGTAFNRYVIKYTSDAYVKGELDFNGTIEEFFLEPSENGEFSGYIDGFLDGITQTKITSVTFTPLDKDYMDFSFQSIDLSKDTDKSDNYGMVYLSNADYTIGIDLDWGGSLTYLEDLKNNVVAAESNKDSSAPVEVGLYEDYDGTYKENCDDNAPEYTTKGNVNLINAHDTGRLVQQSYYGTSSYPYEMGEYEGNPWRYNPVQGGNVKNEPSKIVDLKITETDTYSEIYIKCRPLDWGKSKEGYGDDYITPSYMEAWYTLENGVMRATCRFVDFSGYPSATTTQEVPAFYCVEPLNNFVYYQGGEAWSDNNNQTILKDLDFWGTATDQDFQCNENWGAFIGDGESGYGIGLYTPGQTLYHPGVYKRDTLTTIEDDPNQSEKLIPGQPAANHDSTSYIGVVDTLYFQSYKPISYCYYITTGNVDTMRGRFKTLAQTENDICDATDTNGFCDMCGKQVEPELNEDNVYEISTAGELHWFRDYVNSGNVNANAVLVCDITDNEGVLAGYGTLSGSYSAFRKWIPIGTQANKYNGHFDGQGYTINGLYMEDASSSYGGLFGYTSSNAVIEKVAVDYSFFKANQYVGAICGRNEGTIENCYSLYTIIKAGSYAGGITGYNNGSVVNCYNAGVVNATNYVGGVSGEKASGASFSNCFYLIGAATDGANATQKGIGNAAAGSVTGDTSGATEGMSVEQFANGEVAYLLQEANAEQIWGQKMNTKGSGPVFDTTGDYKVKPVENASTYSLVDIGDVDDNGNIDVSDYQQVVNTALSEEKLEYKDMLKNDIDGDGYLDVIDCALMHLMISGLMEKVDVYLKGDFDRDGIPFTLDDIKAIKKGLINQGELNTKQKYACDLNFDGVLDIKDKDVLTEEEYTVKPIFTDMEDILGIERKTANVIILAGQSNAYGASPMTQQVRDAVGNTDFSNIKIQYTNINSDDGIDNWRVFFSNDEFETFRLGIGGQAENWFGPEVGLSYYLATNEQTKDENWYIIKCTAAGTYLGGNWLYDTTGQYQNAIYSENIQKSLGVYLADGTIGLVGEALNEISNMPDVGEINIRSFMWMQGESDSMVKEWADQYGDLQNILVNKMRSAFESQDVDGQIGFVDGAIAAYDSRTYDNPITGIQGQSYNSWIYSDTVNTHKANNASLWYVPEATSKNVINKTSPGLYTNTSTASNKLSDSIWIDTSTCKSKLVNNNENGEYDGAHYCGDSMLKIGQWFGYGMTQVSDIQ